MAFTLQVIAGAAFIVLSGSLSAATWYTWLVELWKELSQIALGATAVSFIVIDGGAGIMVLTQKFREELRNQGREEGREEGLEVGQAMGLEKGIEVGREEERKAWVEWNERRVQAMKEGWDFNEPPPNGK